MEQRLIPGGPDVVFEEFDGDLVVLNLSSGRYFGFNPAAAIVWEALMAGSSPAQVKAAMANPEDLDPFIEALFDGALVKADPAPCAPLAEKLRDALAAIGVAPMLEAYDDLADLIVADPIHDTDEAQGWPVRAPEN